MFNIKKTQRFHRHQAIQVHLFVILRLFHISIYLCMYVSTNVQLSILTILVPACLPPKATNRQQTYFLFCRNVVRRRSPFFHGIELFLFLYAMFSQVVYLQLSCTAPPLPTYLLPPMLVSYITLHAGTPEATMHVCSGG